MLGTNRTPGEQGRSCIPPRSPFLRRNRGWETQRRLGATRESSGAFLSPSWSSFHLKSLASECSRHVCLAPDVYNAPLCGQRWDCTKTDEALGCLSVALSSFLFLFLLSFLPLPFLLFFKKIFCYIVLAGLELSV